ncbi:MAG TPA: MG2 domain-containing protein [Candidatus Thiothrix moscowensis]|uniref:alpha-2-macroglobulin family protein n=1 Tax=unclassified Thiothrix TaxID=2636184 RepID=UPI0025E3DAD9|nr:MULTISPECIES: MG2 domain-containing protein [unclassified Thiothrix]HRJ51640.1 MG2 domain-containing protein [Candidatus Thiothrix moscowensis]HRJ91955.1 MG2 domain-containing protein [Candidatus Thiothrix moscowensis]
MTTHPPLLRTLLLLLLTSGSMMISGCGDADKPASATTDTTVAGKPDAVTQDRNRLLTELFSVRPPSIQPRNKPLTLAFRQAAISDDKVGSNADAYLQLSPRVAGKARFDTTSSIVFTPDAPLASGQAYTLTVKPDGLLNIPANTPALDFAFKTAALEVDVQFQGLDPVADQPTQMQLEGKVFTSDYVAPDVVEKILQATAQQKPQRIGWEHNDAGTEHRFMVVNIPRETFGTDLHLTWDAKALNAQGDNLSGTRDFKIPSQATFSVTRIDALSENADGKPHVSISFSDALDTQQDLKGLVQLGSGEVTTQIVGNRLLVYPTGELEPGEHKLILQPGIKATSAALGKLAERSEQAITLGAPKPAVRFVGKGSILPEGQSMTIPLEARAVNAVQITALEVFPENIEQFLQVNGLDGDREMERVGRNVWRKTIPLTAANPNQWNRYSIDATELFKAKPGSMYRLQLAVDRRFSTYPCPAGTPAPQISDKPLSSAEDDDGNETSGWDGIEEYSLATEDYDWDKRNDPCDDSYFHNSSDVEAAHNFVSSNLGLIAKQDGSGKVHVIATDLRTAEAAAGVSLTLRNFQGQTLTTATTGGDGFAELASPNTPFLLVADKGTDRAYLKLNANTTLETSQFDVGGETVKQGLKGVIYGERGVWRPGDDIFLTFVLQDRAKTLPANHPVTLQLFDPTGKLKQTVTSKQPTGPFYTFKLKTAETDPTGDWLVKAALGSSTFDKTLKIETVRPNRLKVELGYGDAKALHGYQDLPEATLFAQWLHGGTASGLKADVSVKLREKTTVFTRFNDYAFDDPTRKLDSSEQQLLEGYLDGQGYLRFTKNFQPEKPAAGMLSAWFTSRVHEAGGGFSISKQDIDYYPFQNYVGIKLPKGDAERDMLLTDQEHTVDIASVNADGQEVSLPQVEVTLYKIDWKWWWDKTPDSLAEYADASHSSKLQQSIVSTTNGKGEWKFQIKYPEWGRYLIRACDLQGKHCTGKTLYVDWPGWAGRAQEDGSGAAAMLRFSSDKTSYQVGETAQIQLPEAQAGRALFTVETSSQILEQRWIEFNGQRTQIPLPITAAMAPNAYVSVTLLQAHQNKQNDRPIRLYGIIPLLVEDPATRLQPVLKAAEEWQPQTTQTFSISEQAGRAMDYTLAVVDEGLLGLTRFEAPDLHKAFYRKEALGVKTWDLFDSVIGAYSGNLERILAIGGGDEAQIDDAANKPKRFPPVVRFLGAFHLDAGQTREHSVELPSYLGAVRIMAVASDGTAYGKAEQPVFVRQPLMMLSSLPRTLKVGEKVEVPITLFVSDPAIKSVQVKMEADSAFSTAAPALTVPISGTGEKVVTLFLKAGDKPMPGKLKFTATSGKYTSSHEENLQIQAPNLPSLRTTSTTLEPKADWQATITPHGMTGTNQSTLELSSLPNLHLTQHLDYLVNYPHGCLEQTTSSVFPQLYLPKLLKLDPERQQQVEHHIKRAIAKLADFQSSNGNLMYWPGSTEANDWASIYAGHFLTEAQKQGYNVPLGLLTAWQAFQVKQAQDWVASDKADTSSTQAYRLYVLAVAGKPQLGAMNRLRESGKANAQARWLLGAAYLLAGQAEAAQQTTQGLVATELNTPTSEDTFSQKLGQLGLQLESLLALNKVQDADLVVQQIATELGSGTAYNTHDISWALLSVAHYLSSSQQPLAVQYTIDQGTATPLNSTQPLVSQLLSAQDAAFQLALHNNGDRKLYASVSQRGIAPAGNEQAIAEGLTLQAELLDKQGTQVWNSDTDLAGSALPLQQGQDYALNVTVTNTSEAALTNIALSTLIPSGAEIGTADTPAPAATPANNTEGEGEAEAPPAATPAATTPANNGITHQDVRDDRVLSYFNLAAGESKTVKIKLNAAFLGEYYFPAISSEAMYQPNIRARTAGLQVKIGKVVPVAPLTP